MLTKFGIAVRKLRLDRNLKLRDMARTLGVSSANLSAIEHGRTPVPIGYVETIAEALRLDAVEALRIRETADETRSAVDVGSLRGEDRALVASFARSLKSLPPNFLQDCRELLSKFNGPDAHNESVRYIRKPSTFPVNPGDKPELGRSFMSDAGHWSVEPLEAWALVESAYQVRRCFARREQAWFPIVEFLELVVPQILDFDVDVCDAATIGGEEGKFINRTNHLMIREDVYEAACDGIGWARFVLCHEFAHFFLHRLHPIRKKISNFRWDKKNSRTRDPEWQSNVFAGALQMSPIHLPLFKGVDEAAARCGMSLKAASVTWSQLEHSRVGWNR